MVKTEKKTMSNVELKLLASKAAIKLPTNKSDNGYYSIVTQNKEGILPVATLNVTQLTVLRHRFTFLEAEVYNKGDNNFVTSGATLLSNLDLQETYKAIDSVATGR